MAAVTRTRILVIADTAQAAEHLAQELLPGAGYDTATADALSALEECEAVLVDVSHLRASPLAGLQAQRNLGNAAPALLCAPRLTGEMAADIFELDVRDFLRKPVADAELLHKLEKLVQSIRREREQEARERRLLELEQDLETMQAALKRRIDEMDALSRIGRAITRVDDMEKILQRTAEAAVYLTQSDESAVYLADPASGGLELRAQEGVEPDRVGALWHPSADSIMTSVMQTGQPSVRGDSAEESKVTTGYYVPAAMGVPVVVGKNMVGVLTAHRRTERTYDAVDVAALRSLADFAGIALFGVRQAIEREERVNEAVAAARLVRAHAETLAGPIDGIASNVEALLQGEFDELTEEQEGAVRRIFLAAGRLQETAAMVQETLAEFEPESP